MNSLEESRTIADLVAYWAARTPDAEALICGDERTTYAALHEKIEKLSTALLAAGVKKGDRIATLQTPHPDFVVVFMATAAIGAIWVGLNPRYRLEELAHVVTDCEPRLLFTRTRIEGRDYGGDIAALCARAPSIEQVIVFDGDPLVDGVQSVAAFAHRAADAGALKAARAAVSPRDPCLIVYTSGSTGKPKGALLHHDGIVHFSLAQNAVWPCEPLRTMNYFPINHVGCLIDVSTPTLAAGGAMVMMESFDPRECLALMARERVTMWGSVPSVFQMQLALPDFGAFDLSSVQLIVWEGAAMPAEMLPRLIEICPRLATNYGMTETTSAITVMSPTNDIAKLSSTVGRPFPGVELRLMKADRSEAALEEPGEVWTRSRYNLLGYWRRPDANAESITPDGYFRTGDIAVRHEDASLSIVGRMKEMYKSGGYNVYPREVEAVLETHPGVALAAVVSAPDAVWQEVGVAYVAPQGAVTPEELSAYCRERLANYKVPKRIVIEADMPLLPIGKVDKTALKKRAEAGQ